MDIDEVFARRHPSHRGVDDGSRVSDLLSSSISARIDGHVAANRFGEDSSIFAMARPSDRSAAGFRRQPPSSDQSASRCAGKKVDGRGGEKSISSAALP
jgi:hypothetical protein